MQLNNSGRILASFHNSEERHQGSICVAVFVNGDRDSLLDKLHDREK